MNKLKERWGNLVFLHTEKNVSFQTLYKGQFTKLHCYTLPLMQHCSLFRNLPPLYSLWNSQYICAFKVKLNKPLTQEYFN